MFISNSHRFVFIHIHKTAGSSFHMFLKKLDIVDDNLSDQNALRMHASCSELLEVAPQLAEYYKFAVVRNPYDRMVSAYHWVLNGKRRVSHQHITKFRDFPDYINQIYELGFQRRDPEEFRRTNSWTGVGTGDPPLSYEDQSHYLFTPDDQCQVDRICRFETLVDDLSAVLPMIGIDAPLELPHVNKSEHKPFADYYTDQCLADRVYEMYAKDFALLNYPRLVVGGG